MAKPHAPGSYRFTGWDAITALLAGIACAIVSVTHQEDLGVVLLSGLIVAVVIFFITPLGRVLHKQ